MTWVRGCEAHNRKPEAERRSARFSINLNDEESDAIQEAADRAGLKRATWLRLRGVEQAQRELGRATPGA